MSWVVWITGPPASGKSVIARGAAEELRREGLPVRVLEMDEVRQVLTPVPTYRDVEREAAYRALGFIAATLGAAGVPVIVDATAHRRRWRDLARARVARFAEVQLRCTLATCRERETRRHGTHAPAGIYARAGRPGATVPGVDVPYEEAAAPELLIDTEREPLGAAVTRVVDLTRRLAVGAPASEARPEAWVIWITGRPGSGKSTLARGVAHALEAMGVPVRLLTFGEVADAVRRDAPGSRTAEDIAHRALAYTAAALARAGVPVVVDATAPRRVWRDVARRLAPCFAEVQLVCPPEVCGDRERAGRWQLGDRAGAAAAAPAGLEVAPDYEESVRPDLVLHTHVQGHWTGVEQVVRLARRLPGGSRRLTRKEHAMQTVRALMTGSPVTVGPDTPVFEARQLMLKERFRHLLVIDGSRLVGIVTDRDIRLNLPSQATSLSVWEVNYLLARLTVEKVMARTLITVGPDRDAREAARLMLEHKIGCLPVLEGETLVGIVTETDVLRAFVHAGAAAEGAVRR